MSSLVISGDTSGTVTLSAPAVAGSNIISVQAATGSMSVNTLSTAVASTSGTSIDFTGIPSWVKRITVMFNGMSGSGTSNHLIQIGDGSVNTTGYVSSAVVAGGTNQASIATSTSGFVLDSGPPAASTRSGSITLTTLGSNVWVSAGVLTESSSWGYMSGGTKTLAGTLDRIRITTAGGTDTFDAGSINILYEG